MENPHADLIAKFYQAFQKGDAQSMVDCYHSNIEFHDPAFGPLKGEEAKNMWRMLLNRAKDLEISYYDVKADGESGSANWEAKYTFSKTNRKVHNIIQARFEFKEGKIIKHRDHFNFWKWCGMALGPTGWMLGWSSFLKSKVRKQSLQLLRKFAHSQNN